jgi:type VI secretion system protein ImpB
MAKEQTVAPKERINIVYKPATNMDEEKELPLKLMVVGDFTGRADETPVEDRKRIDVNKDNFNQVIGEQAINMQFGVTDRLNPDAEEGDQLAINLNVKTIKSFHPEEVAKQVPELAALLEIRDALVALKGPLGNTKAFSKKLKDVLKDDASRERLMRELNVGGAAASSATDPAPAQSETTETPPSDPTTPEEN